MVISTDDPDVVDPMARSRREIPEPEATTVAETSAMTHSEQTQVPRAAALHTIEPKTRNQGEKKDSNSSRPQTRSNETSDRSRRERDRDDRDDRDEPVLKRSWAATAIMAAVAGLLIGSGAILGYNYMAGSKSDDSGNDSGSQAKGGDSQKKGDSKSKKGGESKKSDSGKNSSGNDTPGMTDSSDSQDLRKQIEQLSERLDQMHQRMDSMSQPRNQTPPDLTTLQNKVGEISRQVSDIGDFHSKVNQLEQRLEMMQQDVKMVREQVANARNGVGQATAPRITDINKEVAILTRPASPAAPPSAPSEASGGGDSVLSEGISLFKDGKYPAAGDIFRKLQMSHSNDPRVWYLSALTFGLNTQDWNRGAMALLEKGVEREKNGSSSINKIADRRRDR